MAVKLIANYAKRLGLPGYSSHQFSVSVETELVNVQDIAAESERLYQQLQAAVDQQIQTTGFVPPHDYGMVPGQNGKGQQQQNGIHRQPQNGNGDEPWNCTEGQQRLIQQLCHDHKLDKKEVEAQAHQLFGCGVTQMSKLQASQLIDNLLEKVGKKQNGSRWRNSGNRNQGARA